MDRLYFNYFDALLYKLSGVDTETRYRSLLVSLMAAHLKPSIATKILEDAGKLRPGYTIAQLKEDALSIEAAAKDADVQQDQGRTHFKPARSKPTSGNSDYVAYVADLKQKGKATDEQGPRPAYDHPEWYRRDGTSCRFCKALDLSLIHI